MSGESALPRGTLRLGLGLRRFGVAAALLLVVLSLWTAGLVWFVDALPAKVADPDSDTDAIVVLTGGSLRVQSGLALLSAGKAKKLFVSGVYHGVDVAALLRVSRQAPDRVACCVVLGHDADNTLGNALETASWMHQEGFRSLRLVTASYHMRRSLLEFGRAMPEATIVAHPVFPESLRHARWWRSPGSASLVLWEYDKYLLALARPVVLGEIGAGGAP
jgi:uncharacterized SAM-binding protein YcdF (DUF218 family)